MNPLATRALLGDLRQLASVRRIVLDDGAERGVNAIACSTGGGLDYWLVADRALDIGPLWWRGQQLAWMAPQGFVHPGLIDAQADQGRGFERHICGLLASCGLDHVRQPKDTSPLHGRSAMLPARVLLAQEDWAAKTPLLRVCGELRQARLGHENLRMTRCIEAEIGGNKLTLHDEVCNDGGQAQAHDMLYHFNWGYPVVRPGAWVTLNGQKVADVGAMPQAGPPAPAQCLAAGDGRLTLHSPQDDGSLLRVHLSFDLPWLQIWRDLRANCGLLAIEPCASQRLDNGHSAPLPLLQPGESRHYHLELSFETVTKETS